MSTLGNVFIWIKKNPWIGLVVVILYFLVTAITAGGFLIATLIYFGMRDKKQEAEIVGLKNISSVKAEQISDLKEKLTDMQSKYEKILESIPESERREAHINYLRRQIEINKIKLDDLFAIRSDLDKRLGKLRKDQIDYVYIINMMRTGNSEVIKSLAGRLARVGLSDVAGSTYIIREAEAKLREAAEKERILKENPVNYIALKVEKSDIPAIKEPIPEPPYKESIQRLEKLTRIYINGGNADGPMKIADPKVYEDQITNASDAVEMHVKTRTSVYMRNKMSDGGDAYVYLRTNIKKLNDGNLPEFIENLQKFLKMANALTMIDYELEPVTVVTNYSTALFALMMTTIFARILVYYIAANLMDEGNFLGAAEIDMVRETLIDVMDRYVEFSRGFAEMREKQEKRLEEMYADQPKVVEHRKREIAQLVGEE